VLFLSLVGVCASQVAYLGRQNFSSFVNSHQLVLSHFFNPDCVHSKRLHPTYQDAAAQLEPMHLPLVQVNCHEQEQLCSEHSITRSPTVKLFRGVNTTYVYTGERTVDAYVVLDFSRLIDHKADKA
jgi:protein disulfide-isomerase A1